MKFNKKTQSGPDREGFQCEGPGQKALWSFFELQTKTNSPATQEYISHQEANGVEIPEDYKSLIILAGFVQKIACPPATPKKGGAK